MFTSVFMTERKFKACFLKLTKSLFFCKSYNILFWRLLFILWTCYSLASLSIKYLDTVVLRITMLICSSQIAVERKRRNAKIKNPLKSIKTHLMHSNGLKTHRPVKILHKAAIFGGCLARNPSQKTAGSHFIYLVAILKPPISWRKITVLRRIGSRRREPIIAKRKKPI